MENGMLARLLAIGATIVAFAYGATQNDLIGLGLAAGAAVTASVGIYLMPPTDAGTGATGFAKLRDHLLLSLPLAGLSVATGAITLYADKAVQVAPWFALVLGLLVPASVLEQRLNAG